MADLTNNGDQQIRITDGEGNSREAYVTSHNELLVNNDWLYSLGYTDSFSTSLNLGVGTQGLIISYSHISKLMENNSPQDLNLVSTLSSTNDALQIFRASGDNLTSFSILSSIPEISSTTIDNFDSNVTTNWTASSSQLIISQETSRKYEGTGSMKIRVKTNAAGDYVSRNFSGSPLDLSGDDEFSFYLRQARLDITWYMAIGDGTNWKESPVFGSNSTNTWEEKVLSFDSFVEGGTGTTDMSNITIIDFHCVTASSFNRNCYFDILKSVHSSDSETLECELYDFGTNSNPTNISQGTRLDDDNGNSSVTEEVDEIMIGKINFEFERGGHNRNNALTIGNYYGIRIKSTGTAYLWGSSTQEYNNGKSYDELISTGTLTDTGKSFGFYTFYSPVCYVISMSATMNAKPLNTLFNLGRADASTSKIDKQIVKDMKYFNETTFSNKLGRPALFETGDYLLSVIEKDISSDLTQLSLFIQCVAKTLTRYD